ncbi:hypothetical protein F5Y06DRAFT_62070 [Hypoxylon sp. FL0890]|nr:hypothetical protein F5Y06DRAFT_62070 [Hypoxylon sp. FL0890]
MNARYHLVCWCLVISIFGRCLTRSESSLLLSCVTIIWLELQILPLFCPHKIFLLWSIHTHVVHPLGHCQHCIIIGRCSSTIFPYSASPCPVSTRVLNCHIQSVQKDNYGQVALRAG